MEIKLADGRTLEALVINGHNIVHQNASRDSLEFVFSKSAYSLEEIDRIFQPENTEQILIGEENLYQDYTLRVRLSLVPVVVSPSTPDTPEVVEERIEVVMAQKTYLEKQIERLLNG